MLKKGLFLLMILAMVFCLAACERELAVELEIVDGDRWSGKIAIFSDSYLSDYRDYYVAAYFVAQKYETKKMYDQMMSDREYSDNGWLISTMVGDNIILSEIDPNDDCSFAKFIDKIAVDQEVKVLILNPAGMGWYQTLNSNEAIDKLRETREDIFVIYCGYYNSQNGEKPLGEIAKKADLIIEGNYLKAYYMIPAQAAKMGAKTFVYYSRPYLLNNNLGYSDEHDIIKSECEKLDIEFIDAFTEMPGGSEYYSQEDFSKSVAENIDYYGKNTAFFSEHWARHNELILSCYEKGAIYLPESAWTLYDCLNALEINVPDEYEMGVWLGYYGGDYRKYAVEQINQKIIEAGLSGRFSYIPMIDSILLAMVAADYAVKWMNGEVPKEDVDVEVLRECLEAYTGPGVDIETYTEEGITYENYLLLMQPYLIF